MGETNFDQDKATEQNTVGGQSEAGEPGIHVERITELDDEALKQVTAVEQACFSKAMAETEAELKEVFENQNGIHLVIKDEVEKIFGFITSLESNEEFDMLKAADPKLERQENAIYLHSIDIKPGSPMSGFLIMLRAFMAEAEKEGYEKVTMYARINGISEMFEKAFHGEILRRVPNWRGLGEDMDYVEVELPKQEK